MTKITNEQKQERDTPRKVREDFEARFQALEEKIESQSTAAIGEDFEARFQALEEKIESQSVAAIAQELKELKNAIVESAHVMGWPKDLLASHGIKPFDKTTDTLKIRQ